MNIASSILNVGPTPAPTSAKKVEKDQPEFNLDFANENQSGASEQLSFDETLEIQTAELLNLLSEETIPVSIPEGQTSEPENLLRGEEAVINTDLPDSQVLPQGSKSDIAVLVPIEPDTDVSVPTPTDDTDVVSMSEAEIAEKFGSIAPSRNPDGFTVPDEETIDLPNPGTTPRLSPASATFGEPVVPTRTEPALPNAQNPWLEGEDMRGGPPSEIRTARDALIQPAAAVSTPEQQTVAALAGQANDRENSLPHAREAASTLLDLKGTPENRDVKIPLEIQNNDSQRIATAISSEALAKVPAGIATTFDISAPIAEQLPVTTAAQSTATAATSTAAAQNNVTFTPLPPHSHPALQQVAETLIRAQITQSGLSIRLDPPELGNVSIQFQFDSERNVTAIVRTDVAETSTLLRERAEVLVQALKDQGFDSINLSFEHNEQEQQNLFGAEGGEHGVEVGTSGDMVEDIARPVSEIINQRKYTDGTSVDMKL